MPWYTPLDTNNLVERLQKANWAYHNTDKHLMTDDDFDRGLEELRRRTPSHPFLSVIGAPVSKGCVVLPVCMGSQDKVRAGEGGLARWLRRDGGAAHVKNFIVSEKLDGLSALFVLKGGKKSLYLRGDGVKGVDCSAALGRLALAGTAKEADMIIRGELLLRKDDTPAGSIGRSIVNGWMHRAIEPGSKLPAEFAAVRFVAYQVVEPAGLARGAQMAWLASNGFETPWWGSWSAEKITEDTLTRGLIERKTMGAYPLDGLIVATDTVPVGLGGGEAKNPPDSMAFKVSLDDQKAETRVVAVVWTASRLNVWIPRIQIEPVEIGGATIQWLSGHNAAFIADNGLGAGARIVVRRSGDVIPALDEVLERCPGGAWAEPEGQWEWDANHVHAKATDHVSPEKAILHALQTLGVEGIGPGLVAKLVEKGFDTMAKIWTAKQTGLSQAIGSGRAPAFMKSLKEKRQAANYMTLLIASNRLPRGVGERKMRILFDLESNPAKWLGGRIGVPEGWSEESLGGLWKSLPAALDWIVAAFPGAPLPALTSLAPVMAAATPINKYVVFTGVRDKELEGVLGQAGWGLQDTVTSKTTVLVVADDGAKESGKTKKAAAAGVKIMKLAEFKTFFRNT